MCPTFLATGEEYMSTRGRANAIRAALDLRTEESDPLRAQELGAALSDCLACKACTTECPSNVNCTAESGAALRAHSAAWPAVGRAVAEQGGLVRQARPRGHCRITRENVSTNGLPHAWSVLLWQNDAMQEHRAPRSSFGTIPSSATTSRILASRR